LVGRCLNGWGDGVDAIDSLNVLSPQLRRAERLAPPWIAPDDPTQIRQQFGQDVPVLLTFLRCKSTTIDHLISELRRQNPRCNISKFGRGHTAASFASRSIFNEETHSLNRVGAIFNRFFPLSYLARQVDWHQSKSVSFNESIESIPTTCCWCPVGTGWGLRYLHLNEHQDESTSHDSWWNKASGQGSSDPNKSQRCKVNAASMTFIASMCCSEEAEDQEDQHTHKHSLCKFAPVGRFTSITSQSILFGKHFNEFYCFLSLSSLLITPPPVLGWVDG